MIDFPASPTVGQNFSAAGVTWQWDGAKWTATGLNNAYVKLAGDTMTGPLTLPGNPVGNLQAVPKQYVDAFPIIGDNRIINGDMRIDQRNNGAVTTPVANAYVIDRWAAGLTQAGKFTAQRITTTAGGLLPALGFGYFLSFVSTSAYAVLASDQFVIRQPIEADFCADFAWGTPNAQPVTLSFWAMSSLSGTFGGAITNAVSGTRSYPFIYSIPTANTWTKIVIIIPGDSLASSTNWVLQGNGVGAVVIFGLGCGSTFSAPAGAWASGDFRSANGAVSVVGTNGATLNLTGVKLEIGSVATPFNRQSLAKSMVDCQRYYLTGAAQLNLWTGATGGGGGAAICFPFPVSMRATPTITTNFTTQTNATGSVSAISSLDYQVTAANPPAVGMMNVFGAFTASAEL